MTGTKVSRASHAPHIALALAFLLVALITPLSAEGSSADSVTIQLTDSQGRELGDTPFFSGNHSFNTDTIAGITTYVLEADHDLNPDLDANLLITSGDGDQGYFSVEVSMAVTDGGDIGYLGQTGIVMVSYEHYTDDNGEDAVRYFHAILNTTNQYRSCITEDTSGQAASLRPGQMYPLRFYTQQQYSSTDRPAEAEGISFTFGLDPAQGTRILTFKSMGETVRERAYHEDDAVGELPPVSAEGYELQGWYDEDNVQVTADTIVSQIHGDTVTASWREIEPEPPEPEEWPKVTVVSETIYNDDGSVTERTTTTTEYEDGTVNVRVSERTVYPGGDTEEKESEETVDPDGKKDGYTSVTTVEIHEDGSETWVTETESIETDGTKRTYETVINYDPDGNQTSSATETTETDPDGSESRYWNETVITRHDDGSETWDVKEGTSSSDGTSESSDVVTEYDPDSNIVRETKDVTYTDPDGETREYIVTAELIDEKEKKYRVDAILPDTTVLDVDTAKAIIDEYDYSMAVVGVYSDTGVLIIPEETVPVVVEYGYYVSVTNHGEYVLLDTEVVKRLADRGGDIVLTVERATEAMMTPEQARAVGGNYAVSVLLTVDDEYVSELGGRAEIVVEPGYESAEVYYVDPQGQLVYLGGTYDPETGRLTFDVEHFSIYMVAMEGHGEDTSLYLYILTFAAVIVCIMACVLVWRKRRGYDD